MVFDLSDLMSSNLRLDLIAVDLIPEMGLYELTERHLKMGSSCRHVTEIGHVGLLGCDVQRDENRQYVPN